MKANLIAAAVVAALTLPGLAARAACVDQRSASQATVQQMAPLNLGRAPLAAHSGANAGEQIVGTWHVVYTTEGSSSLGQAFIQWHSDGTEWENIDYPVLGGNICMGSWKVVDQSHIFRNHFGWLFNEGVVAGYFNETETDSVAADGNSYIGRNETTFYDLMGMMTGQVSGTATAKRIVP